MRIRLSRRALCAASLFLITARLFAAPVAALSPKDARRRIASAAEAYRGVPYLYGGLDRSGLDCSGLVYVSLRDSLGERIPRTVRTLHAWVDPVPRRDLQPGDVVFFDTVGRLTHVGIYLGEGRFIHAASEGARTGVIESSLDEAYWVRTYSGAGRIVAPADYLGIQFTASGAVSALGGSEDAALRGAAFEFGAAFEPLGFKPGLELRPEWDAALGVFRLPLVLSLGFGDDLRFFIGPALVLGDPSLRWNGAARAYSAAGGLLATGGVYWAPLSFRAGSARLSLYGELAWQRYEPLSDESADFAADVAANFRASAGIRVRWGI